MQALLTPTQTELLKLIPAHLSGTEMSELQVVLKLFAAKMQQQPLTNMVAEPAVAYAPLSKEEQVVLTIPRTWLDDAWLAKLMNWMEMKRLTERNQMTEAQAQEMGEQSKADWWAKNQAWVLAKIGEP